MGPVLPATMQISGVMVSLRPFGKPNAFRHGARSTRLVCSNWSRTSTFPEATATCRGVCHISPMEIGVGTRGQQTCARPSTARRNGALPSRLTRSFARNVSRTEKHQHLCSMGVKQGDAPFSVAARATTRLFFRTMTTAGGFSGGGSDR